MTPMGKLIASNLAKEMADANLRTLELQLTSQIVKELKSRLPENYHIVLEAYYREIYDDWYSYLPERG